MFDTFARGLVGKGKENKAPYAAKGGLSFRNDFPEVGGRVGDDSLEPLGGEKKKRMTKVEISLARFKFEKKAKTL